MICYKDKTFCASKTHKGCGRELTDTELKEAERLGLGIAYSNFCD